MLGTIAAGFITIPLIVFMVVVAPLWLLLHYRAKRGVGEGFSEEEMYQLNELSEKAEQMAERIATLESILDHEVPDWRRQHEQ